MRGVIDGNPWLGRLSLAAASARATGDAAAVHELRSASRRLDVWLRLAGRRALRDDLRWLRREAAAARDLDIALEGTQDEAHRGWLLARREAARLSLRAALDGARWAALTRALPLVPPVDRATAREHLGPLAKLARARLHALSAEPSEPAALHALRRALRTLRFAHGWLGREPAVLSRLQDELGAVGDAAVRLAFWQARAEEQPAAKGGRREALEQVARAARGAAETLVAEGAALERRLHRWSSTS